MKKPLSNVSFRVLTLFMALAWVSLPSCEWLDETEPIPAFLQVDTIELEVQGGQGSKSHKISDAWVFVNNQLIGVFEMPSRVPVLESGTHEIEVFAGVSENGIASQRQVYPFYARYKTTADLVAGSLFNIEPTVRYDQRTVFEMVEDFETSNVFGEDLDGSSLTRIEVSQQGRFEGTRSGVVQLTEQSPLFETATSTLYSLPIDDVNNPIYLELNYRNNVAFEVGLIAYKNGVEIGKSYPVGLNPKETWNKVYLNLTNDAVLLEGDLYRVAIRSFKTNDVQTGEIFLDNIKLLHF